MTDKPVRTVVCYICGERKEWMAFFNVYEEVCQKCADKRYDSFILRGSGIAPMPGNPDAILLITEIEEDESEEEQS